MRREGSNLKRMVKKFMPKLRVSKDIEIDISEELNEYFKSHSEDKKDLFKQIREKVNEYRDLYVAVSTDQMRLLGELDELRRKYSTLKGLKISGASGYILDSIVIPKATWFRCNEGMTPVALLLYGILLDCRLDALSKKQLDSRGIVYITLEDIESKCAQLGMPELTCRVHPDDPLPLEVLENNYLIFTEDSRIYVKVFPDDEPANAYYRSIYK